jgi:hypothetical protein
MIHAMRSGKTITIKPKMMHMMAKRGLETVTPIFFNPFSTASAKHFTSDERYLTIEYLTFLATTNLGLKFGLI